MRENFLILHFIGLAMGVGASFASVFLSMSLKQYDKEKQVDIAKAFMNLIYLSKSGLLLLIISGLFLMQPYWALMKTMPLLHVKFTLVFLLLINVILMTFFFKRVKKDNDLSYLPKLKWMGRASALLSLIIIFCATMVFK